MKNSITGRFLSNVLMQKIVISFIVSIFLVVVIFFSMSVVNLFEAINTDKKTVISDKLVYKFEPNTIAIDYEKLDDLSNISDDDPDINEQFLSYGVSYGIDVSEWQGKINWEKVASTGISFAIIRCGFRYIESNELGEDARFKENIEGAINSGLKVGVYFYGTAINKEEAREEAEYTVNLIKDYNLTYPVVYDAETFDRGRLIGISDSVITENILTYMDVIESYGYASMVYSNSSAFYNRLDTGKFDSRLLWLAHYIDKTDYKGNYNMWQYTSEGSVSGIDGFVDLNVSYFKYVDKASEIAPIPENKEEDKVDFVIRDELVKVIRKTELRSTPSLNMPNKITSIKKGEILKRVGYSKKISKILYNGRVVYVSSDDLNTSY